MQHNDYDRIAKVYDLLSQLIFGQSQKKAQTDVLHHIGADDTILMAGGGTGWILEEIANRPIVPAKIIYVESSFNMLELAQKRALHGLSVDFIHSKIESYESEQSFDVVITAFLFDNFPQERANIIFHKLDRFTKPSGKWLFTDFHIKTENKIDRFWQSVLLRCMYFFFGKFSRVEARSLPHFSFLFKTAGYSVTEKNTYYRNFIQTAVYQKTSPT